MLFLEAQPNAAHKKLAELEAAGKLTAVITQNIDGLHQAAGSKNVLELHGSVHRNYCTRCRKLFDAQHMKSTVDIPLCTCGNLIKPDVVLYEESLDGRTLQRAVDALENADLLIIGGTSLAVYPAAGLIQYFGGSRIVLINRDATPYDRRATLCIREPIGQVLGQVEVR
jgi:NAD-dependent deacetylase